MVHNKIVQNKEHLKLCLQSQNTVRWVQVLTVKSDDLGAIPETHKYYGDSESCSLFSVCATSLP